MSFSVKPAALRAYAGTVSGAGSGGLDLATFYINDAPPYVDRYLEIDLTSGVSDLVQLILSSKTKLVGDIHTT